MKKWVVFNSFRFNPTNDGSIYAASSDGTISCTDLETGISLSLMNLNPNGWEVIFWKQVVLFIWIVLLFQLLWLDTSTGDFLPCKHGAGHFYSELACPLSVPIDTFQQQDTDYCRNFNLAYILKTDTSTYFILFDSHVDFSPLVFSQVCCLNHLRCLLCNIAVYFWILEFY